MKTIAVQVRDHDDAQPAERFLITLYNPHGLQIARVDGVCDIPAGSGQPVEQNGPLILNGLITNAYHDDLGRGGYFHHNSGTSEGQSIGIEGSLLAYQVLNGGTAQEQSSERDHRRSATPDLSTYERRHEETDHGAAM